MTTLRINLAAFKEACKTIRSERYPEDAGNFSATREYYRDDYDFSQSIKYLVRPAAPVEPRGLDDIRAELNVAAMATGPFGATRAQIDLLAQLAFDTDECGPILTSGLLTRAQASKLIDSYKADAACTVLKS